MNAPAYATAMGQAILAFLPEKQLDVLLNRYTYKRYSPRSVTDQNQCRVILAEVRRSGYATDIDDRFPGFGSVACPVFDPSNHVDRRSWRGRASRKPFRIARATMSPNYVKQHQPLQRQSENTTKPKPYHSKAHNPPPSVHEDDTDGRK